MKHTLLKASAALGLGLIIYYGVFKMKHRNLNIFEFGKWFAFMNNELLLNFETLVQKLKDLKQGYEVEVVDTGRKRGEYDTSRHNYDKWGEVRALDFRITKNGKRLTGAELLAIYYFIKGLMLFNGIGVYPNWNTSGFHIDIRYVGEYKYKPKAAPAIWGDAGVYDENGKMNHEYTGIEDAIARSVHA